jgi:hypothetical protein
MKGRTRKVPRGLAPIRDAWAKGDKPLTVLSKALGTSPSYLWYILTGNKTPSKKKHNEILSRWKAMGK